MLYALVEPQEGTLQQRKATIACFLSWSSSRLFQGLQGIGLGNKQCFVGFNRWEQHEDLEKVLSNFAQQLLNCCSFNQSIIVHLSMSAVWPRIIFLKPSRCSSDWIQRSMVSSPVQCLARPEKASRNSMTKSMQSMPFFAVGYLLVARQGHTAHHF